MGPPYSKFRLYRCTWLELPSVIDKLRWLSQPFGANEIIFRGQRDSKNWFLQSAWEREFCIVQKSGDSEYYRLQPVRQSERTILQGAHLANFRLKLNRLDPELSHQNDDALWAFGQHHGLITPLLDWTYDFRVAAYFAFAEVAQTQDASPVAIWALPLTYDSAYAQMWSDDDFPEIKKLTFGSIEQSARQRVQCGVFTRLSHPIWGDLGAYLDNVLSCQHSPHPLLVKIELQAIDAGSAMNDLERSHRISKNTIFPPETAAQDKCKDWGEKVKSVVKECNEVLLAKKHCRGA